MAFTIIEEMKRYVGFDDRDAATLAALAETVDADLPSVVDRFYAEILRHPGARRVLAGGEAQAQALRGHLLNWLKTLFGGVYDEEYARNRARIGHVHVRIGLPQHYMFAALEVVRQELERIIRGRVPAAADVSLGSLHKLMALETGMMLETYKSSYSNRIRELERHTVQERLSRAEQLAEIGQLAASLAHELKNPLAGISGAIQVIRDDLADDDPNRPILVEVLRQINRLDGTVKALLAYARPHPPSFKTTSLAAIVDRVTSLLRPEPSFQKLRIDCEDCRRLPAFEADEHQIEQVLVNLLLNAAHASPPGGTVRLLASADDAEVTVIIEDQGHGMDEALCRRALEPFYTTKARGTGLGLPICQRIVDAHGGAILIRSEPGRGTAVEVRLPRRQNSLERQAQP